MRLIIIENASSILVNKRCTSLNIFAGIFTQYYHMCFINTTFVFNCLLSTVIVNVEILLQRSLKLVLKKRMKENLKKCPSFEFIEKKLPNCSQVMHTPKRKNSPLFLGKCEGCQLLVLYTLALTETPAFQKLVQMGGLYPAG